jgi:hypothetical protein
VGLENVLLLFSPGERGGHGLLVRLLRLVLQVDGGILVRRVGGGILGLGRIVARASTLLNALLGNVHRLGVVECLGLAGCIPNREMMRRRHGRGTWHRGP